MRDPGGVVQEMSSPVVTPIGGKDYSRNTNFNCMATSGKPSKCGVFRQNGLQDMFPDTWKRCKGRLLSAAGDGYIVIGSEDGQIRLYSDKSLTRANTAISTFGAPITAVDVTFDGKWVVATTNKYLMVLKTVFKVMIPTGLQPSSVSGQTSLTAPQGCIAVSLRLSLVQDKKDKETNGFKSRMGEKAPKPRLLRLKPEDNVLVKAAPLTKGKFTWVTESGRQERWIVASCGNYTVLWNFRCALHSAGFGDPTDCAVSGQRATVSVSIQGILRPCGCFCPLI